MNKKFCVKIGKNASETLVLLTLAYDEYVMKKQSVLEWRWQFKEGLVYVQDDRAAKNAVGTSHKAVLPQVSVSESPAV
jgi:hypothetical protein